MIGDFQSRKARYEAINQYGKAANLIGLAVCGVIAAASFLDGKVLKNETRPTVTNPGGHRSGDGPTSKVVGL